MSDEFLKALYRISDGGYKIIEMYIVGKDIGIPNTQVDDIVNDLSNMGLIKKIGETDRYKENQYLLYRYHLC